MTDAHGPLPDPRVLVRATDWATLEHAYGPAEESPALLVGLLADDLSTQARALRHLEDPIHHQNSVYSATVPAALFVAAALKDPSTATALPAPGGGQKQVRAALLDWLESVADAVGNAAEATMARLGLCLESNPVSVQVRALRPAIFRAVSAFLHDPDAAVQEAAIAAAISLLDAPELEHHRSVLTPLVRGVLATSADKSYRFVAARGLSAWGQEGGPSPALQDAGPWARGWSTEPPF
ncbi:hypothetical protein ADK34_06665 [Streptomyces viridochromogenes]|uniref:HEAT repeat-containing protein n=1 Tax=Streptomyces viridochromogenes TaxID=1938 RepID=A0A0L8LA52_STRVR|nr:hypothetical protein ADK34_06665 [Streptomyces viridochromogenes]